jgi:hypothetical protein
MPRLADQILALIDWRPMHMGARPLDITHSNLLIPKLWTAAAALDGFVRKTRA